MEIADDRSSPAAELATLRAQLAATQAELDRRNRERECDVDARHWQRMAANLPGMVYRYVLHADGTDAMTYVSPKCREIYELEPEELLADFSVVWSMIHPDDADNVAQANLDSARNLNRFESEFRLVLPSGNVKWVRAISAPQQQANGNVVWDGFVHFQQAHAFSAAEVELLDEVAVRTWDAVERARAEGALRASEVKYRSLFESIDEGFCSLELIYDRAGVAVDYRLLEANPVFTRQTGLENVAGKLRSEIAPGEEEPHWLALYTEVVRTGQPQRFESYHEPLGRWYRVFASRLGGQGSDRLAVVFDDITEQQAALRERKRREAHQAVLVEIADDLQRLTTPDEIMRSVGSRLGKYLNLSSCIFVDVDEERGEVIVHHDWNGDGVASLGNRTHRMNDYVTPEFQRANRAQETIVVCDVSTDERVDADAYALIHIGAWFSVPYHRDGRWMAFLSVTDTAPRDWRADEIELVRDIAARIFPRIERARTEAALRGSEVKYRSPCCLPTSPIANVSKNSFKSKPPCSMLPPMRFLCAI